MGGIYEERSVFSPAMSGNRRSNYSISAAYGPVACKHKDCNGWKIMLAKRAIGVMLRISEEGVARDVR